MIERNSGAIVNVNAGAVKAGLSNLSSYCCILLDMTIFLGQVATKMCQDFNYNYYEKNKNKICLVLKQSSTKDCRNDI
jgi:hypothetical protein